MTYPVNGYEVNSIDVSIDYWNSEDEYFNTEFINGLPGKPSIESEVRALAQAMAEDYVLNQPSASKYRVNLLFHGLASEQGPVVTP